MPAFVSALKRVDLPTLGRPTMPHFRLIEKGSRSGEPAILVGGDRAFLRRPTVRRDGRIRKRHDSIVESSPSEHQDVARVVLMQLPRCPRALLGEQMQRALDVARK